MIIDFTFANYGPFRDSATLSMIPSAMTDRADAISSSTALKTGILKTAVVFGANASGKSYIFEALADLRDIVSAVRPNGMKVPGYRPFRLSRRHLEMPVDFRIRLDIGGTLYDYSISFTDRGILSERLSHSPRGRSVVVFSRGGEEERMDPMISGRLTDSSSYLYVAAGYNDAACNAVLQEILSIHIYQHSDGAIYDSYFAASGDAEIKEMMESALDAADLGIKGFAGEKRAAPRTASNSADAAKDGIEIQFIHSFEDSDVDESMLSFPSDIESNGTLELFAIMGPISDALKNGRTVVIDEFGSDLHPVLTRWIVGLFNCAENQSGAQLIVNTHDLGLMDIDGFLRRDEVWFTEKNRRDGSSALYSLADIRGVKKGSLLRKDYLMGRYDGIPAIVGVRKL